MCADLRFQLALMFSHRLYSWLVSSFSIPSEFLSSPFCITYCLFVPTHNPDSYIMAKTEAFWLELLQLPALMCQAYL